MSRVVMADWTAIKNEYLRGVVLSALAAKYNIKYGTLAARSFRGNWVELRKRTMQKLDEQNAKAAARDLTKDGASAYVSRVKSQINRGLDGLEHIELEDLRAIDAHAGALEKYDRVGRKAYGLDDEENGQGRKMTLQLYMMRDEPGMADAREVESVTPCQTEHLLPETTAD